MIKQNNKYISTAELAKLLGISRVAVFKKIQKGEIKANKNGRNYSIKIADVPGLNNSLSLHDKRTIGKAVDRTVREYRETLRLLAKE